MWPDCGQSIRLPSPVEGEPDIECTCTLPQGHEMDGSEWHEDRDMCARWRLETISVVVQVTGPVSLEGGP